MIIIFLNLYLNYNEERVGVSKKREENLVQSDIVYYLEWDLAIKKEDPSQPYILEQSFTLVV